MVQLVYGRAGSGKTTLLYERIRQDAKAGRKVLLLVPDQQVFESERRICEEKITGFSVEAAGFSRLCNRIFRRFGGLCYHYIGKGAKMLVMWRAIRTLSDVLEEYGNLSLDDLSILSLMQKTVEELERCRISPEDLEHSAELLTGSDERLKRKLNDLARIYALDLHLLHQNYDNPEEDLTRAAGLLENHDFFAGMQVYIDGFDSYTPQEADMIRHILRQAENVTVSVPCLPHERGEMYGNIKRSERLIGRLISECGCEVLPPEVLEGRKGVKSEELRFLTDHIWNFGKEWYPDVPKDITLTSAADIYAEAEAVACEIARLVQEEGVRYREIAVVMRSTPSYEGILDQAFEKYGIPCFSSTRTRLRMKPQIRLIGAALSIVGGNWRYEDVISYLRSGLCGLDRQDCDLLEEYATTWNISGRQWYEEDPWSMNPEGFSSECSEDSLCELTRLEELRRRLTEPLIRLQDVFREAPTVRRASEALYDFLMQMKLPDQLDREEEELRQAGRLAEAQECVQVWDAILSAMDDLVTVAGDLTVQATGYSDLLFTVFDSVDIGKIPARADEVILGDPGLLHKPGVRHAFLLGLCEGVFPAAVTEDSVFGDDDRQRLEILGLELEENSEIQAAKELYGVYRALSVPSEALHLSYHADLNPSVAVFAVQSLFPELKTKSFSDISPGELIRGANTAFEYAAGHPDSPTGIEILHLLADSPEYNDRIRLLGLPIGEQNCRLSEDTADLLMKRGLNLTQARIENFVKCPFSYYAKNILRLREPVTDDFESRDVGNFMHSVFENFLLLLEGRSVKELDDQTLSELADLSVKRYRGQIVRGKTTERLEFLFERLTALCRLFLSNLIGEFRNSEFEPKFAEYPIDKEPGHVAPLTVPLGDGRTISIYGRVDRVDSYHTGNKVYLRVVDYKTGAKNFSTEDLKLGLNLQMLIYLFSLCATDEKAFLEGVGCQNGEELLPAGILYYVARAPEIPADEPQVNATDRMSLLENKIARNGLLLNDLEVLRAMDRDLEGKYIPVKLTQKGVPRVSQSLATKEDFARLLDEIKEKIAEIGREMASGKACASPLQNKRVQNPCKYCDLKKLCRVRTGVGGTDR
ncbi:MAG: PD-(D/E)XK nuclease family protein [Eubacteriales bacterium]